MDWTWFQIFNLSDFDNLNVPDYTFEIELPDKGIQSFRIIKGSLYSIIVDEIYLTPGLNEKNGFSRNGRSAYIDENRNLWVGYAA